MEKYNFDEIIERHGTDCVKYDLLDQRYGNKNLTPLWVADMDFRTPDFIVDAIKKRCEHSIFGYTYASETYYSSIINWLKNKYAWSIHKEWLSYIPGIVKGIAFVLDCFTQEKDKVIIQSPVYHPFRLVPTEMNRQVVYNPLKLVNGAYEMDFEQLESVIDEECKVLILCNPHNPGGIVWSKESLVRLAEICSRHGILVISDEIHAEMVYPGYAHHPFPSVSDAAASCSITFMAPSKTFNIAGIVSSYAIIPNDEIRLPFFRFLKARELNDGTIFAYAATTAAYTQGAEWHRQMVAYVIGNVDYVDQYLQQHIPEIKAYRPHASFLLWLDCKGLHLSQKELICLFEEKAGLALNNGMMFGKEGEGYMRMNVGCPRSVLEKALASLKAAIR